MNAPEKIAPKMPGRGLHLVRPRAALPGDAWRTAPCWPVCYRSQASAGLPEGPLIERPAVASPWRHLCFGFLIGLLLVGPALADLWESLS